MKAMFFLQHLIFMSVFSTSFSVIQHEQRLMDYLFKERNYSKYVRPVKGSVVNVTFGIVYVQMIELNDQEQALTSNIWVRQFWTNRYLVWNPIEYGNITEINVDPKLVWLPDIVLYNSAAESNSATKGGIMYQFKTRVIIDHTGRNSWFSPTIIRSGCNIDTEWFPFDRQKCDLLFGSWSHDGNEIDIFAHKPNADLSFLQKRGDFVLVSAKSHRKITTYPCCDAPYPTVSFQLVLQRQPSFHMVNVIIPSLVMTTFAFVSFALPTGERIGLVLNLFLALSFISLMISETMPVNSDITPIISRFLLACQTLITATVGCNLISFGCYYHARVEVPNWVKQLAFRTIGPCVGMWDSKRTFCTRRKRGRKTSCIANMVRSIHAEDVVEDEQSATIRAMQDYIRVTDKDKEDVDKDFWRCIAQCMDRTFLMLFVTIFLVSFADTLIKGVDYQRRGSTIEDPIMTK